jgi:hypothetical protein
MGGGHRLIFAGFVPSHIQSVADCARQGQGPTVGPHAEWQETAADSTDAYNPLPKSRRSDSRSAVR